MPTHTLNVNGEEHTIDVSADTPLLTVLRHDLGLKGPKYGCGEEQCGACKVLVDGQAVPSCQLPVKNVVGLPVITVEGLGTLENPHPLQEAFAAAQAMQCGYCAAGMIVAAQGLLNRVRYPTDDQIREALDDNLCRCGAYDRVRRAIKMRVGRPDERPNYEVITLDPLPAPEAPDQLPRSVQNNPALDTWIGIHADGTITLRSGKVEYGQGIKTALAQIGANELDVEPARIRMVMGDTAAVPDEGLTVGSMSLETSGEALRWAAAEARGRLLDVAYETLEAPRERLVIEDGTISDPESGRSVTYWELQGDRAFGGEITGRYLPKSATAPSSLGTPLPRVDIPGKVAGIPTYVHDLELPDMLYGRIVRPPHRDARLQEIDLETAAEIPGVVAVIRKGGFVGVVAERPEQAEAARVLLVEAAVWRDAPELPEGDRLYDRLFGQAAPGRLVVDGAVPEPEEEAPPRKIPAGAALTLRSAYVRPYQMHGALGPSAAAARWDDNGTVIIWAHTQGVFPQRAAMAHVLGIDEEQIRIIQKDGPGVYGHNGSDDAALEAALLAREVGNRPVLLQWTRADEHAQEPYAPAMRIEMQASLDEKGNLLDWNHDVWSPSHSGRPRVGPGISGFLAAQRLPESLDLPPTRLAVWPHSGSHRNADPIYNFEPRRIVKYLLPETPLRVSSLRSLGALANVFAIESFVDEVAHAAALDPLAFRLRHLDDLRARAVLEAAARKAGWQPGGQRLGLGRGRGLAFARYKNRQTYAAVVVDVAVDLESGEIALERVVIAADAGRIVNPDGLSNQLEGGFVQAASMTLLEEVSWNEQGITSLDWDTYPILRFSQAPVIETVLLNRPEQPWMGAGEATAGPTPAAIANAVFAATGLRLRRLPLTPAHVRAAADMPEIERTD